MSADPAYQLGNHAAQLEAINNRLSTNDDRFQAIEGKVDELLKRSERQVGMVKLALWISTALGALIGGFLTHGVDKAGN